MALVIKREGVLPSKKLWVGTCRSCKTAVEFLTEDAIDTGDDQRDGKWATVICPLSGCNQIIHAYPEPPKSR